MDTQQLRQLVEPQKPTISIYCDTTGDEGATELRARLIARLDNPPDWIDSSEIEDAIEQSRQTDAAGVAVFCRETEPAIYATMVDPPTQDLISLGTQPMLVPLLEAMHRSIDHTVVEVETSTASDNAQVTLVFSHFPENDKSSQWTRSPEGADLQSAAVTIANEIPSTTKLVLIHCDESIRGAVADRLATILRVDQKIIRLDLQNLSLADEVVRQVADLTATEMVDAIRSLRFAVTHNRAVEGVAETLYALANRPVHRLFVSNATEASIANEMIRAGILAGVAIQIVPGHLADAPADGVGATLTISEDDIENGGDDGALLNADAALLHNENRALGLSHNVL